MKAFTEKNLPPVTEEEMRQIFEKIRTPRKLGAVMKWEDHWVDSPTVFRKGDSFYMYFIAIDKNAGTSGYETHLAKSPDPQHWEYVGPVLQREESDRWDSRQCAGYAAFLDIDFDGTYELQPVNGSYYISYLAGSKDGYEPDPLSIGLAKSEDPTDCNGFTRSPEPMFSPDDEDARELERRTLYKSYLFEDKKRTTGHRYVNVYNAKGMDYWERIFLAVSDDGENWERYGDRPVIDFPKGSTGGIFGDPQILLLDDIYVMFFFRYETGKSAYNSFACSRDLIHWKVWDGEPLIKSEYEWEDAGAHKTWFVRRNGVNYHFYCAINSKKERFIALAVSE